MRPYLLTSIGFAYPQGNFCLVFLHRIYLVGTSQIDTLAFLNQKRCHRVAKLMLSVITKPRLDWNPCHQKYLQCSSGPVSLNHMSRKFPSFIDQLALGDFSKAQLLTPLRTLAELKNHGFVRLEALALLYISLAPLTLVYIQTLKATFGQVSIWMGDRIGNADAAGLDFNF